MSAIEALRFPSQLAPGLSYSDFHPKRNDWPVAIPDSLLIHSLQHDFDRWRLAHQKDCVMNSLMDHFDIHIHLMDNPFGVR